MHVLSVKTNGTRADCARSGSSTRRRRYEQPSQNWDVLSLDALWNNLNDPQRHATPQSTIEAILYSVRRRGLAALKNPTTKNGCRAATKPP